MVDQKLQGRRAQLLFAMAVFQAVIAPLLDAAIPVVKRLSVLRSEARALQHVAFADFSFFSLISVITFLLLLALVAASRVAAMLAPDDLDDDEPAASAEGGFLSDAQYRVRDALRGYWTILKAQAKAIYRRPTRRAAERAAEGGVEAAGATKLRWFMVLAAAFVVLQSVRALLTLLRWIGWITLVSPLDLQTTWLGHFFEAVSSLEGVLATFSILDLLGASALTFLIAWEGRPLSEWLSLLATSRRGAVVLAGGTRELLEEFQRDLQEWKIPYRADHERKLRDSLVAFLWDRNYEPAPERLEVSSSGRRRRIDIVLDAALAIEIKRGLNSLSECDRAASQLRAYADIWTGRGVVVCLVVDPKESNFVELQRNVQQYNAAGQRAPIRVLSHLVR